MPIQKENVQSILVFFKPHGPHRAWRLEAHKNRVSRKCKRSWGTEETLSKMSTTHSSFQQMGMELLHYGRICDDEEQGRHNNLFRT